MLPARSKIFGAGTTAVFMNLDELLLSDYGTVPQKIGTFLLRRNALSLEGVRKGTGLADKELRDGLSLLIQRRLVNFFIFERTVKYYADKKILRKRLYFPLYMHYMAEHYPSVHFKLFTRVLVSGTVKMPDDAGPAEELLNAGILLTAFGEAALAADMHNRMGEQVHKKRRTAANYLVVDYSRLEQKIFEMATAVFLSKRYNEAAAEVYKAILKCEQINKVNIIKSLNTTKILLLKNGAIVNDRNNIDDYLQYLCSSQVLCKGADAEQAYIFNTNTRSLKTYRITLMIRDPACRRLFNLIGCGAEIDDKALTMGTLLSVSKIKESILHMQRCGLLHQRCLDEYKSTHRIEHSWTVDLDFTCRQLIRRLEDVICCKLKQLNGCWDVNYYMEDAEGNDSVWMSDLINLSMDHLILSLD